MSSYQRIALYIFFDAIERDLVFHIRSISNLIGDQFLTEQERAKGRLRIERLDDQPISARNDLDLIYYLDLGDKIAVIQRLKLNFETGLRKHLSTKMKVLQNAIPVRNSLMHGRPLTVEDHSVSFALANDLVKSHDYWPNLRKEIVDYDNDPEAVSKRAIKFLEEPSDTTLFHNLPLPDYDDTGFLPRTQLEQELKKKILARHPIITVLGDGGNGKTALTLQSLYSLINSGDHNFEAVVWVSAKSTRLTVGEIERIENAIVNSIGIFEQVAGVFGETSNDALGRVRYLLENNKILLVIDNLETVLDDVIREFTNDIPGESKVIFTSRIPVGGDLTIYVGPLSEVEGEAYLRALIKAYSISALEGKKPDELRKFASRLSNKPLLLKWFCMGVISGLLPERIVSNPEMALKFCLENVFFSLSDYAKQTLSVILTLPQAVPLGVLQHVSGMDLRMLESGVAELLRYTIIEVERADGFESIYKLKPFARAYATRVLQLESANCEAMLQKFRGLSYIFQTEKGAENKERYSLRNFSVRSISEALAVRKLRIATRRAASNDFEGANEVLSEVKISNPDFFEVYRTEAFIRYREHDLSGACDAYETAIDISPNAPQLHYFYGGFLLRAYGDCKRAINQLNTALELDPSSPEIKRELARIKMYDFDFSGAEQILAAELTKPLSNLRSKLIFSDLRVQNFHRIILHLASVGIDIDLEEPMENFKEFLDSIDASLVDETMLEHLRSARSDVFRISISKGVSAGKELLESLDDLISWIDSATNIGVNDGSAVFARNVMGTLKENGRRPNFGFLVEGSGREAFLPRAIVDNSTWHALLAGGVVKYDIEHDDQGRFKATNVTISGILAPKGPTGE